MFNSEVGNDAFECEGNDVWNVEDFRGEGEMLAELTFRNDCESLEDWPLFTCDISFLVKPELEETELSLFRRLVSVW